MTRRDLDQAPHGALTEPYAYWLACHSTACPRCQGPRDSHAGCDHCREQDERAARHHARRNP